MDSKTLGGLKESLENKKIALEKELSKFAKKDENLKGDWDTRFPRYDGHESGDAAMEKAADEVEEYSTLLSLEHNLELQLQDIGIALEKMKKGTYGICENCHEPLPLDRLKAYPEARLCLKCENK